MFGAKSWTLDGKWVGKEVYKGGVGSFLRKWTSHTPPWEVHFHSEEGKSWVGNKVIPRKNAAPNIQKVSFLQKTVSISMEMGYTNKPLRRERVRGSRTLVSQISGLLFPYLGDGPRIVRAQVRLGRSRVRPKMLMGWVVWGLGWWCNGPKGFWGLDWAKWVLAKMVWDLGRTWWARPNGLDLRFGSGVRGPKGGPRWGLVRAIITGTQVSQILIRPSDF